MKKWLLGLTALLCCLLLAGCGGGEDTSGQPDLGEVRTNVAALTYEGEALFPGLQEPGEKELQDLYGIDASLFSEYVIGVSDQGVYLVVVPKEGEENAVKNAIASAMSDLGEQNALYNPEQTALLENRMETIRGSALIYIASRDNAAVLDAIDSAGQ
ncbi:DUF4358 domain-containing protein [Zongyangia hominis]|uniref:DUF4358 domain-containing protein n=1 Tax=Zongyangia hominis TaxID=2763677 RepID=A0A926EC56_9FIRM|nr:DUF4358 domain-containing protein [Zongyangia hominis]MBC8571192.1 DUF4358 domain-containing protein [Zongyangia hominis]